MKRIALTFCFLLLALAGSAYSAHFWSGPVPAVAASGNIQAHYEAPAGVVSWIDLRTEAECATDPTAANGVAVFATANATDLNAGGGSVYADLGTNPERQLTAPQCTAIATALRLPQTPATGTALADVVYGALTTQADPTGATRVRPLVPASNANGVPRFEVWLGGQKIRDKAFDVNGPEWANLQTQLRAEYAAARQAVANGQLPPNFHRKILGYWVRKYRIPYRQFENAGDPDESDLPPSTTITDNFNRANGAIGSSSEGWSWTAVDGTFTILSNQATSASSNASARAESNLSSADHYAQGTQVNGGSSVAYAFPCARFSASAETYYALSVGTSVNNIYKRVAGTYTALQSVTTDASAGLVLKIQCSGTTITGFKGGVSQGSLTDSSISGNLRTGMGINQNDLLEDFSAADLSVAPTAKPQIIISRRTHKTDNVFSIAP